MDGNSCEDEAENLLVHAEILFPWSIVHTPHLNSPLGSHPRMIDFNCDTYIRTCMHTHTYIPTICSDSHAPICSSLSIIEQSSVLRSSLAPFKPEGALLFHHDCTISPRTATGAARSTSCAGSIAHLRETGETLVQVKWYCQHATFQLMSARRRSHV